MHLAESSARIGHVSYTKSHRNHIETAIGQMCPDSIGLHQHNAVVQARPLYILTTDRQHVLGYIEADGAVA